MGVHDVALAADNDPPTAAPLLEQASRVDPINDYLHPSAMRYDVAVAVRGPDPRSRKDLRRSAAWHYRPARPVAWMACRFESARGFCVATGTKA